MMLDAGYLIADLGTPYVRHIGEGVSRAIEPLPPMPRVLIAIPACFRLAYTRWESDDSPHYNQSKAWEGQGYGTGIHLSGDNDRIQAVRDTWAKDLAAFPNVTLKYFYGLPEGGYPRQPLEDEVFLTVPDDYAHLPHKVIEIARYAVAEGYDYLFKGDDDTYVWIDRLIHELLTYKFDYAGWDNCGMASGGVGYWLSNRAARLVAEDNNPDCWNEDGWTGKVMAKNGVPLFFLPSHIPSNAHWFDILDIPSDAVTIHAVKPDDMRTLYARGGK
jgi:hypothetical protein